MVMKLAGCVLLDKNGRIGLLHRNKSRITQWELPGGKVASEESDTQAAARELKEELGVMVSITARLGNASFKDSQKFEINHPAASRGV